MLTALLPYEVWEDGPLAVLSKLADRTLRQHFAVQLADGAVGLENVRIAWVGTVDNQHLLGMSLAEYARRTDRAPVDAICDLLIEESLAVTCVWHLGDDRLVEPFLAHSRFMLGSDGIYFPQALTHPRQYGSAARILGPIVRERRLFTLEDAVRKMTSIPAARFGLTDRGIVEPGAFADIVVFNAETIADRATFAEPQKLATGVEHVIVNGTPIVAAGTPIDHFDGPLPGRALRYRA